MKEMSLVDIVQSIGVIAAIIFQIIYTNRFSRAQIFNSVYERLASINSIAF